MSNQIFFFNNQKKIAIALGIALLFCGIFTFQSLNLGEKTLWIDEAYTVLRLSGSTKSEILQSLGNISHNFDELKPYYCSQNSKSIIDLLKGLILDDVHPPLYFLGVWFWSKLGGCAIGYLRLLSVFFNGAFIYVVYYLGLEIYKSKKISILATLLIACSPIFLIYAQEARSYSLLILLVGLSSLVMLKAINSGSQKKIILYGFLSVLGLYCHTLYWLVLLSQIFYLYGLNRVITLPQWPEIKIGFVKAIAMAITSFGLWLGAVLGVQHFYQDAVMVTVGADYTWNELPRSLFWKKLVVSASTTFYDLKNQINSDLLTALHLRNEALSTTVIPVWQWILMGIILSIIFISIISTLIIFYVDRLSGVLLIASLGFPFFIFLAKDLLLGGYASTIIRYQLPTVLGIYFCVAFVLGKLIFNQRKRYLQFLGVVILTFLLQGQLMSNVQYLASETWWSKGQDRDLPELTSIINNQPNPFFLFDYQEQSIIELLTLAYPLDNYPFQLLKPSQLEATIAQYESGVIAHHEPYQYLLFLPSKGFQEIISNSSHWELSPLHPDQRLYQLISKSNL